MLARFMSIAAEYPKGRVSSGSTASRVYGVTCRSSWLFVLLAACLFGPLLISDLYAHPVAQGRLEIVMAHDRIVLHATVTHEELLVTAATLPPLSSPDVRLKRHGEYLLEHIRLIGNGQRLEGKIIQTPAAYSPWLSYTFEYRVSPDRVASLKIEEDVLREFEFAPGNPWEASYIVRITQEGREPVDSVLLSFREPLEVTSIVS